MKKEFTLICLALFLLIFGTYLSGIVLVPYTMSLGGTGITIGITYSCMYVVRLLLGTPIGRLSQKKGTKKILIYSLLLYPFIAGAYYLSFNIPSLLAARLLHGFASAMMLPMAMAYIGEISPSGQEGRYMGIYNTILFAASAAGPLAGGIINDRYGMRYAFLSLFVLAIISLIIMLSARSRDTSKVYSPPVPAGAKENSFRILAGNRRLRALCLSNIITAILLALLGASFTQLELSYRLSLGLIGMLTALYNIVIGALQIPLGRLSDRCNKLKLTLISGIVITVLILFLPFFKNVYSVAVILIVLGIFIALNLAAASALSAILGKENGMGKTMGAIGSAYSAGTIAGYLLLGLITDLYGINTTFFITASIFLIGSIAICFLWKKRIA